ncbi:MAG TPA: SAM-dependent methyltransferase, partial [Desulfobacteria bacterium]|nr:SAM-dependent methyltransferase [Desulfobacteria bacterium]
MAKITVVGLGPGALGQMSVEVYRMLKTGKHIFLRTSVHPCVDELRREGVRFKSFDSLYEEQESFQLVYEGIVNSLIMATGDGDVIYAVPGHPRTAEKSVALLLEEGAKKG